jgi:peptidoglycan/LPS O-acetylase OafA/YrhL
MKRETWRWVAGGGAAAMVIGSFMPWVKIAFVQAAGTDGGDGWFFVIGGLVSLLVAFKMPAARSQRIALTVVGALLTVLAVYEFVNIGSKDTSFGKPSYGSGLYLVAAGAVATLVAGLKPPAATPTPNPDAPSPTIEPSA